jgi:hypothetical protein
MMGTAGTAGCVKLLVGAKSLAVLCGGWMQPGEWCGLLSHAALPFCGGGVEYYLEIPGIDGGGVAVGTLGWGGSCGCLTHQWSGQSGSGARPAWVLDQVQAVGWLPCVRAAPEVRADGQTREGERTLPGPALGHEPAALQSGAR